MYRFYRLFLLFCALVVATSGILLPDQQAVAQAQSQFNVYLPIVTDGNPQAHADPSSEQLIDQALQAGTIDRDTAALYKTFAAFEDPRLPAGYRGDDLNVQQTSTLRRVAEQFPTLAPATQAQLAPFFLPPSAAGSWLELREQGSGATLSADQPTIVWRTVSDVNSPIKVWYQARFAANDAARAEQVFAIANQIVWPALKDLLQREPISDVLQRNNGADGRYDIYLVPTSGKTIPYVGCDKTSAYSLLDSTKTDQPSVIALLTYGFLYGYDLAEACSEYDWLMDATAIWANDHIDFRDNSEQQFADDYFYDTDGSLESAGLLAPLNNELSRPMLGRYMWPFYLARKLGQPALMRTIWQNNEQMDSLTAINSAIPGGFADQWPKFALAGWNRDPIIDYVQIDALYEAAHMSDDKVANLPASGQWVNDITPNDIPYLGKKYYHYTFPDEVSGVTFFNGWTFDLQVGEEGFYTFNDVPADKKKGAKLQALVKLNGEWQKVEDWTERPLAFYCRDKRAQRIDELVLIVSNSEWQDRNYVLEPLGKAPRVAATNVGCNKWEGTIVHRSESAFKEYPGFSHQTTVATVAFEAVAFPADVDPEYQLLAAYSFNAAGSISFAEEYERYVDEPPQLECGGKAIGRKALNDGFIRIGAAAFPDSSLGRMYDGEGTTFIDLMLPACESENAENVELDFFRLPAGVELTVNPNGRIIEGSWSPEAVCDEWETCSESYSWTLISRREQ